MLKEIHEKIKNYLDLQFPELISNGLWNDAFCDYNNFVMDLLLSEIEKPFNPEEIGFIKFFDNIVSSQYKDENNYYQIRHDKVKEVWIIEHSNIDVPAPYKLLRDRDFKINSHVFGVELFKSLGIIK